MNIRLYHARILTMEKNRPVFRGEIWVKNDKIVCVLNCDELGKDELRDLPKIPWDVEIDCGDNLLMPGFKDAHTHSAMIFLRSYADDLPLDRWLKEKVFPAEEKLTEEDIFQLTRLAVLEYLASGVTSVFEMYLTPDSIAEACIDMGMRCVLTSGLNDFTSSIEQMEEQYVRWNKKNSLISYQMGFHAEYTCSKDLLYHVAQLAHKYKAPVYTHLAETKKEVSECMARHGMTPAVFLETMGIFDFGGGYHCVHMTNDDIDVFSRRRLSVITNPSSNLKLASGIAPVAEYVRRKIPVAIGTDGAASNNCLNMFREMFLVAGLSKMREEDPASMDAQKVLRMATVDGARVMGLPKCDVLARGKLADIIMIDLQQPNMYPLHSVAGNLVYSGCKANVRMTMINGRILYRDGEFFVGESVDKIYSECDKIIKRIL